jgi:DNA-binding NarL/FixJ family response regulator
MTNEPGNTPSERNSYGLTAEELLVVSLIARGLADPQIALQLGVSAVTVGEHLDNIRRRMGARSRTEVAIRALKEGLAGPPGTMI